MKISRRNFLKGSATTLFLAGFNFPVLANAAKKKNLVIIMLRGGMDGLCAVPITVSYTHLTLPTILLV